MIAALWILEASPLPHWATTGLLAIAYLTALPWLEPLLDVPDRLRARKKKTR